MFQNLAPFKKLSRQRNFSERKFAELLGLSRTTVRSFSQDSDANYTLNSLREAADFFERDVSILVTPKDILPEYSTIAVALMVESDGFESWKIHYFNFVDEFRRSIDPRLILIPPPKKLNIKLRALLASIVRDLAHEAGISTPSWAAKRIFLEQPWFVADINSLKASALLESPLPYRDNNIFVQNNFLKRA